MASFSTVKGKMERNGTQTSYICRMELGERYLMRQPWFIWYLHTTKQALSKAQVKTHTHKKLTYFPEPYTTELSLKKWKDSRITAVPGQFIFWSQSMSPVTLQQASVMCISIYQRVAVSETHTNHKKVLF